MKQEVQFQKITNKKASIQRPKLYKLNGLTLQNFSVNLAAILVPDNIIDRDETVQLSLSYMITLKKNRLHFPLKIYWQLYGTMIIQENGT